MIIHPRSFFFPGFFLLSSQLDSIMSYQGRNFYCYLFFKSFSHQCQLMVFHWSLSDSKSLQVSSTRLSILAVLINAVIWIVSTRPPTFVSSRPFNNPLVIVPKAPIIIGAIVTFMFHSFFNSLARLRYLSFFFPFLQIYYVVRRDSKVDNFANYYLLRLYIVVHVIVYCDIRVNKLN